MPEYSPAQFAAVLTGVATATPRNARDVVEDSAKNLRDNGRRNAALANPVHARQVPRFINYDMLPDDSADIGYDKRGQGNLGAILEYANGEAHNAPQRNLGRAMDVEEPRFQGALADLGERQLEG